jgi:hypothetical protein
VDGTRVSYWNNALGRRAGRDAVIRTDLPKQWFDDDEFAVRLYRNVSGYELALYGYRGYWKSPAGMDMMSERATFPKLSAYGASIRGSVAGGIGNVEMGLYDSREDRTGRDPFVRNSEVRLLLGYEREVGPECTLGAQYYLERMLDYDHYRDTLPVGAPAAPSDRHVFTFRFTKLLMQQNLEASLFVFYGMKDDDAYVRPRMHYKISDHWSAEIGGNFFFGKRPYTFFGQFEDNSNVYVALRYGF